MYLPKASLSNESFDHSVLKRLQALYIASDPFDHNDADETFVDAFPAVDFEAHTDGSDGDETSSNHDNFSQNDFALPSENEAEEWREVLSYYFYHGNEGEQEKASS